MITIKNLLRNKSLFFFSLIILTEALSFMGYLWPGVNKIGFALICLATIFLAAKNLRYALLILLVELVIGSKGYLFFYEFHGAVVSVRIAMWLIVMSFWLTTVISAAIKHKRWPNLLPNFIYANYFYALGLMVAWGTIMALFRGNDYGNIFFDLNNWFYLSLLGPLVTSYKSQADSEAAKKILGWAVAWLVAKTLLVLYFLSHDFGGANLSIYRWLRTSGVGEVTQMASGFFRIFFQSHIYALMALFLLLPAYLNKLNHKLTGYRAWLIISGLLGVVIISLSRSFWLGLMAGLLVWLSWLLKTKVGAKQILKLTGWLAAGVVLSLLVIALIIKFPWPTGSRNISAWDTLNERGQLNESAASSRWSLIPKLWQAIKVAPLTGQGFGKTVTYQSSDPRILEQSPDGTYETYAFEWGWLDIWLKMGLSGVLTYLCLLLKLIGDSMRQKQIGLALCLITLATVHFFTPYLNHPLGLGIIMLSAIWINNEKNLKF